MANSRKDDKGRVLRKGESYRKKNEMYQYSYTDESGKRQYVYAKDLMHLRQKETELLRDRLDGIDSKKAEVLTLNNVFDKYISGRIDLKPWIKANYEMQYNAHVRKNIGNRKIKEIRYSDMVNFYTNLLQEQNLSMGTVEYIQRVIRPAFEMAVRDNIIRYNPTEKVLRQLSTKVKKKKIVRKALTLEQQRAFLSFLDEHPVFKHWKPIFTFLIGTGVRVSEFCGLTWNDVDLENDIITIGHQVIYFAGKANRGKQRKFISEPKTEAGIRKIPIVKEVREALEENKRYLKEQGIEGWREIDGYSNFVFLNKFGDVHTQSGLDRNLHRLVDAYNDYEIRRANKKGKSPLLLPNISCHNLRHTFCTRICENESNLKVIQELMGHVDIQTTMNIYAEVSDERRKSSLNAMSDNMILF